VDTTQEHASGGDAPPPQQSKSARAAMRKKRWCGCWRNSGRWRRDLPRASASEACPTSLAGSSPGRSGDRAAPFIATAAAQESACRHAPYPRPRGQSSKTGITGRVYPAYPVPRRQGIAQHGAGAAECPGRLAWPSRPPIARPAQSWTPPGPFLGDVFAYADSSARPRTPTWRRGPRRSRPGRREGLGRSAGSWTRGMDQGAGKRLPRTGSLLRRGRRLK
jgi:hypothetical protein